MVDKEIVLETVRKMYESGIEDSVVEQTLKDIGLGQAEIRQYLAEVKGVSPAEEQASSEPKPLEARQKYFEEKPDHAALHATTHVALEEQSERAAELLEKLGRIEEKMNAFSGQSAPEALASANQRLASMEKQLRDLKAELSAAKTVMEKILETDRKVLNKL